MCVRQAEMPPAPPKSAGKAAKRQHYLRLQAKRRRKETARGMQKLATQHARLLLRALKTAKNMELAKASRRIKSAAEGQPDGAKGCKELTARRDAIKSIAVPELLAAAVETHHLELLVEHSPKQFETTATAQQGAVGGDKTETDAVTKQAKFFRLQAMRKIVGVNGVTKVVQEFQRATLALIAAEEADRSKGTKRKGTPPGTGTNSNGARAGPSGNAVSQFVDSLNSGVADISSGDEDAELYEAMARRDGTAKNRRGQKARQKIAEKKHGQHAKHLIKAKQKEVELAAKRAEARAAAATTAVGRNVEAGTTGAAEENRKQKRARLRAEGKLAVRIRTDGGGENNVAAVIAKAAEHAHVASASAESGDKRKTKKRKKTTTTTTTQQTEQVLDGDSASKRAEEPLHPSWAAKRQAKTVVPTGTRIVFD